MESGLPPGTAARAAWTAAHLAPADYPGEPGAIVAGPGQVLVGLFDVDRTTERIVSVPSGDVGFRIVVDGQTFEQCAAAADGRPQYAPMR